MSLERRIRQFNALLESELGANPLYAWKHTDSQDMTHPMVVYVDDPDSPDGTRQVYDYVCGCGTNRTIHEPQCRTLSHAVPRVQVRPLMDEPWQRNSWVLCSLVHPNEVEWINVYGTAVQYPRNGKWMPVSSGPTTLIIPRNQPPTEESNQLVIRMMREFRSIPPGAWVQMWAERKHKAGKQHEARMRDQIHDILSGGSLIPGSKHEKSFATPQFARR